MLSVVAPFWIFLFMIDMDLSLVYSYIGDKKKLLTAVISFVTNLHSFSKKKFLTPSKWKNV
jgi:hypothetical protein